MVALRRLVAIAALVGAAALHGAAQPEIRGRVVADDTGEPIRNARVIAADDAAATPVFTDSEGRFALPTVPSGARDLAVTKAGYAAGRSRIDAGEIRLAKGAVVTGRVADEFGEPMSLVSVSADRVSATGARPTTARTTAETDDRGEYRIFGLSAGEYLVSISGLRVVGGPDRLEFGGRTVLPNVYPGGAVPRPIPIATGEEIAGINLSLRTRTAPERNASGLPMAPSTGGPVDRPSTGIVRGRVLRSDGLPLSFARVELTSPDHPVTPDVRSTDDDGRYEFRGVTPGAYLATVDRPGYRTVTYGQRTPTERGELVTVGAGAVIDRIDVTLPRGDAITGRVVDEYGDPVGNAAVSVGQLRRAKGRRQMIGVPFVASTRTDDLGRYRVFGLPPGRYIVGAVVGQAVAAIPVADLRGYARTFFPAAVAPTDAEPVDVTEGQDRLNVDIALVKIGGARIAGRIVGADGKPSACTVALMPSARSGAIATAVRLMKADDRFEFDDLSPGEYIVQASKSRVTPSIEGEFASEFVTVKAGDAASVVLRMSAGSTISGRLRFEGGDPPGPDEIELSPISTDVDFDSLASNPPARAEFHDDWSFDMAGVNGPRRLNVTRAPDGWMMKEILLNGFDVTDTPLPFGNREQSLAGIEVVMTRDVTEIAGVVTDARGRPSGDAAVIAFATDANRWYRNSRFVGHVDAARDGTFSIRALAPGDYVVAAVDKRTILDVETELENPEFLESLTGGAARVRLEAGQRATVSVRTR